MSLGGGIIRGGKHQGRNYGGGIKEGSLSPQDFDTLTNQRVPALVLFHGIHLGRPTLKFF